VAEALKTKKETERTQEKVIGIHQLAISGATGL